MNLTYKEWENLIDSWIFSERDRIIMKRHLLDGIPYEKIAAELDISRDTVYRSIKKQKSKLAKYADLSQFK